MSLVLDASLTLSWFFKDERTPGADAVQGVRLQSAPHKLAEILPQNLDQRQFELLAPFDRAGKNGGLLQFYPHIETDQHHDDGHKERDAPAPHQKGVPDLGRGGAKSEDYRQPQEEAVRQEEAERRPELRPHRR